MVSITSQSPPLHHAVLMMQTSAEEARSHLMHDAVGEIKLVVLRGLVMHLHVEHLIDAPNGLGAWPWVLHSATP